MILNLEEIISAVRSNHLKKPDVPNIRVSHDRLVSEKLAGKSHWFEGYFSEASSRNKIIRAIATVGE